MSLGREKYFLDCYDRELLTSEEKMKSRCKIRAGIYASSFAATYLGYGISLWYGGILISNEELEYQNAIKVRR